MEQQTVALLLDDKPNEDKRGMAFLGTSLGGHAGASIVLYSGIWGSVGDDRRKVVYKIEYYQVNRLNQGRSRNRMYHMVLQSAKSQDVQDRWGLRRGTVYEEHRRRW